MIPEPPTPEALWAAWRKGDDRAFERLYAEVRPGLTRFCRALTRGTLLQPDDLLQETFRRAIAAAGSYRGGCSLMTWLAAIARRAFLDDRRSARRHPEAVSIDLVQHQPENRPATADILDRLACLPAEQREAIALRYLQGLTLQETADVLGISLATVKRRIADGFDSLGSQGESA